MSTRNILAVIETCFKCDTLVLLMLFFENNVLTFVLRWSTGHLILGTALRLTVATHSTTSVTERLALRWKLTA